MTLRVVTMTEDGWSKVAVVKPREEDPTMWGVVGWYDSPDEAKNAANDMLAQRGLLAVYDQ